MKLTKRSNWASLGYNMCTGSIGEGDTYCRPISTRSWLLNNISRWRNIVISVSVQSECDVVGAEDANDTHCLDDSITRVDFTSEPVVDMNVWVERVVVLWRLSELWMQIVNLFLSPLSLSEPWVRPEIFYSFSSLAALVNFSGLTKML